MQNRKFDCRTDILLICCVKFRSDLVFILDEGGEFDAPVEKFWRFMSTPGDHHKHASMSNRKFEKDGNNTVMSFEVESPYGAKTQVKIRSSPLVPVGRMLEYLEGPLAGSKVMSYYIPKGQKTGVTLVGEYVSKVIPEGQIKTVVMNQLEQSFKEDTENLKNFQ